MDQKKPRTDLALEERERFPGTETEIEGVSLEKFYREKTGVLCSKVCILTDAGAEIMGKPVGSYLTLESEGLRGLYDSALAGMEDEFSRQLAFLMEQSLRGRENPVILVAGLGNREITADALGPIAADEVQCSDHVKCVVPGVMGRTGLESVDILAGIQKEIGADLLLVIDALAARNTCRLHTTIQITDTGIRPGSGVGNHRKEISRESFHVPVLAIGIPTVVDAGTIVIDTMSSLFRILELPGSRNDMKHTFEGLTQQEKYQLMDELISPMLGTMHVTPKEIDLTVRLLGRMLGQGIMRAIRTYNNRETAVPV